MNLLAVDIMCPEVSDKPLICHVVDLDEAKDGGAVVTVDREFFTRVADLASTWTDHPYRAS